ncbi:MAG: hypothetical protein GF344_19405 [Chitinivibrionales bacterium]|nr:hypothetical protein [Chitinivibrionales bacterium]MBD3358792.1 hypothetical protein [Chitinivibrionales bacterium]
MLGEEKVEFVIVGGYAVAFHDYVRATEDLDLFFRNDPANIDCIRGALCCATNGNPRGRKPSPILMS